jgi:hypothetical protein
MAARYRPVLAGGSADGVSPRDVAATRWTVHSEPDPVAPGTDDVGDHSAETAASLQDDAANQPRGNGVPSPIRQLRSQNSLHFVDRLAADEDVSRAGMLVEK